MFANWWGGVWTNVPASGALRWGNGHWTYADLVPPEDFPFVVEAKFHCAVDLDEVIRFRWNRGRVTWFWFGCTIPAAIRATEDLGRTIYPMLVYRMNSETNRLVLQNDLVSRLPAATLKQLNYVWVNHAGADPFVVFDFKKFLEVVPKQLFQASILS